MFDTTTLFIGIVLCTGIVSVASFLLQQHLRARRRVQQRLRVFVAR